MTGALMRVELDSGRCQGHGQCAMAAPEVFAFDDQGFAVLQIHDVPVELADKVRSAALRCPERAISITQETFGTRPVGLGEAMRP